MPVIIGSKAEEHIAWMEANKATIEDTAEHFGITHVGFLREIYLADYKGPIRRRKADPPINVNRRGLRIAVTL